MSKPKKYSRKYYVISASDYKTKDEALMDLEAWKAAGDLKDGTLIYEVTENTKVYKPQMELKET